MRGRAAMPAARTPPCHGAGYSGLYSRASGASQWGVGQDSYRRGDAAPGAQGWVASEAGVHFCVTRFIKEAGVKLGMLGCQGDGATTSP